MCLITQEAPDEIYWTMVLEQCPLPGQPRAARRSLRHHVDQQQEAETKSGQQS
jgi:hypothetical protein